MYPLRRDVYELMSFRPATSREPVVRGPFLQSTLGNTC